MKIKECLIEGLGFLGLNNLVEKIKNNVSDSEVDAVFGMAKNVIDEICCDYYPLKITESKHFVGGKLSLDELNSPIDVFCVRFNGVSVPFRVYFDRIESDFEGVGEVTYSFAFRAESIEDVLPFTPRISARLIGYGIACEYCVVNGMSEAVTFDKRFKDGLKKALVCPREKRIRGRIWA